MRRGGGLGGGCGGAWAAHSAAAASSLSRTPRSPPPSGPAAATSSPQLCTPESSKARFLAVGPAFPSESACRLAALGAALMPRPSSSRGPLRPSGTTRERAVPGLLGCIPLAASLACFRYCACLGTGPPAGAGQGAASLAARAVPCEPHREQKTRGRAAPFSPKSPTYRQCEPCACTAAARNPRQCPSTAA